MAIRNAADSSIRRSYTTEELRDAANYMRGLNLIALNAAGSGHSGGTLSIMDITAALYLSVAELDPEQPEWDERDRIIWSTGHKAPALYIGLGMAGFFDVEEVVTLRRLGSPFQGHPHWLKLPGVEASTGSLGQGLSIAIGQALRARLDHKEYTTFAIMGDGEQQEGQIWEAVMAGGHYQLDNLVGIIDNNRLQIDGWTRDVMNVEPLAEKYQAFGWHPIIIDGHEMSDILEGFETAKHVSGKPVVLIASTIKGKGVDFMEDVAGWHGRAPNREELLDALNQLGVEERFDLDRLLARATEYQREIDQRLDNLMPGFSRNYWWSESGEMQVEMDPTRKGFGRALAKYGDDERVIALGADISGSITISDFYARNPERKPRFLSMGIAEQSMTCVAAGLAREGKIPVIGTYGVFASGRNWDQIRTTAAYGELNVFIAGAHGGISVGPDGATHQALEEMFLLSGIPGMSFEVPCDSVETERAAHYLLFDVDGPKYLRFAREATPIVTSDETPWEFGRANVIRFRGAQSRFADAFEHVLASEYQSENEDLTIIANGPEVPEAMRAAWILKEEYGLETRVLNLHTLKPIDREAIVRSAKETQVVLTAEEHQIGGMGNWVANVVAQSPEMRDVPHQLRMIGVMDRFGESGAPWELIKEFGISAEHLARAAKELYDEFHQ